MKITFYSPHLGLRGTDVTMFDYAYYGRKFYGWDIQILYNKTETRNHPSTINKFKKEFDVFELNCDPRNFALVNSEIEKFLEKNPSDYFYMQKGGKNDGICPKNTKTCILCCSIVDPEKESHGDSYAFISDWLSNHCSGGKIPVVPSIVDVDSESLDFRDELSIPKDAIVFGRSGGMDTWNLNFTNDAIRDILNKRGDIYFVFQNTPDFLDHERIIHVESTSDMKFKSRFINTCDALLHARREGESFGLVCGEFSSKNKRVITYRDSPEKNHIEILGDKALYFSNTMELYSILNNFKPEPEKDWNCYRNFEPKKVMKIFKEVFLGEFDEEELSDENVSFGILSPTTISHVDSVGKEKQNVLDEKEFLGIGLTDPHPIFYPQEPDLNLSENSNLNDSPKEEPNASVEESVKLSVKKRKPRKTKK